MIAMIPVPFPESYLYSIHVLLEINPMFIP